MNITIHCYLHLRLKDDSLFLLIPNALFYHFAFPSCAKLLLSAGPFPFVFVLERIL